MKNAIETLQLSKYYGKVCGIDSLSFSVPEGQIFGFIGPNGSGKSTLIRTLLGLLSPSSGKAYLLGEDIQQESGRVRGQIGYVPSEVNYYDDMKVSELLEYSASFYQQDENTKKRRKELADTFDLDLKKPIDGLSLGNKKKVALVQAMQHNPRLLVLDEATGGLDPLMQTRLASVLEEEHKKGVTVFFSSHVLSEVQRLCQSVAIIRNGRLVDIANIETLRAQQYKRVKIILPRKNTELPLLSIDGVSDISFSGKDKHSLSFLYKGNLQTLFHTIGDMPDILDALVEDPSLEEIFLTYYGEEEADGK